MGRHPARKPSLRNSAGTILNNLQEIRLREGLKLVELARLARLSERILRDIERGRRPGNDVTLNKIVNALNQNPNRVRKEDYQFDEVFPSNRA